MIDQLIVGADPEFFLSNRDTGAFVSATEIETIWGNKQYPQPLECGGAVQIDGTALEVNVVPAHSEDEFFNNVQAVMEEVASLLPHHLEISPFVVAKFEPTYFDQMIPEEAKLFGCSPDRDVYRGRKRPPHVLTSAPNHRMAGGHIHIGMPMLAGNEDMIKLLVSNLDRYIGSSMLKYDWDTERRKFYGAPSIIRDTDYGIEYRSPSNAWLVSENYIRDIYRQTRKAVAATIKDVGPSDEQWQDIRKAMKTGVQNDSVSL